MTTNKPGSVNQRPLYGCTSCYDESQQSREREQAAEIEALKHDNERLMQSVVAESSEVDRLRARVARLEEVMNDEADLAGMLQRDITKLETAGMELAEAAARVVHHRDGVHRLSLALAEWHKARADQGDRGNPPDAKRDDWVRLDECDIEINMDGVWYSMKKDDKTLLDLIQTLSDTNIKAVRVRRRDGGG